MIAQKMIDNDSFNSFLDVLKRMETAVSKVEKLKVNSDSKDKSKKSKKETKPENVRPRRKIIKDAKKKNSKQNRITDDAISLISRGKGTKRKKCLQIEIKHIEKKTKVKKKCKKQNLTKKIIIKDGDNIDEITLLLSNIII